jgi:hypothetical protein
MILLSHQAQIRRVSQELPGHLLAWQNDRQPEQRTWDIRKKMRRLGVLRAWPMKHSTVSELAYLVPEGWGGFAGDERTVGLWVTTFSPQMPMYRRSSVPIRVYRSDTRYRGRQYTHSVKGGLACG